MDEVMQKGCFLVPRAREMDRIGVWGFGNVSRDVVVYLVDEVLGKEIVFYGRPQPDYPNRAGVWVDDLKANATRCPRIVGTNRVEDMASLDVIFIGAGVPRKEGQTRRSSPRPVLRSAGSTGAVGRRTSPSSSSWAIPSPP